MQPHARDSDKEIRWDNAFESPLHTSEMTPGAIMRHLRDPFPHDYNVATPSRPQPATIRTPKLIRSNNSLQEVKPDYSPPKKLVGQCQTPVIRRKNPNDNHKSPGFHSASGKPIAMSDEALEKGKALFFGTSPTRDAKDEKKPSSINIQTNGFQTSSGKIVEISPGALAKGKELFFGSPNRYRDLKSNKANDRLPSTLKKSILPPPNSTPKQPIPFDDDDSWFCPKENAEFDAVGFSSASGRKVHISEETISRGQALFQLVSQESMSREKLPLELGKSTSKSLSMTPNINQAPVINVYSQTPIPLSKVKKLQVTPNPLKKISLNELSSIHTKATPFKTPQKRKITTPKISSRFISPIIAGYKKPTTDSQNGNISNRKKDVQRIDSIITHAEKKKKSVKEYLSPIPNARKISYTLNNCIDHFVESISLYERLLSKNVQKSQVTLPWFINHLQLITWKILSYQSHELPIQLKDLSEFLADSLYQRYFSEYLRCKRSFLRLLCEKDECSQRYMTLLVCDIRTSGVKSSLLLSDGWYTISAFLDSNLNDVVQKGLIKIGQKLSICHAKFIGNENGCPILDLPVDSGLQLSFNSTKRARWDQKLGCHPKRSFISSLKSLRPKAGLVPCIDIIIIRKYPLRMIKRHEDGKRTFYSADSFCKEMDEKCMTYFVRFEVCDYPYDLKNASKAILTLWNPHSDLLELLQESKRFRIHGATISDSRETKENSAMISVNTIPTTKFLAVSISNDQLASSLYTPRAYFSDQHREKLGCGREIDIAIMLVATVKGKTTNESLLIGITLFQLPIIIQLIGCVDVNIEKFSKSVTSNQRLTGKCVLFAKNVIVSFDGVEYVKLRANLMSEFKTKATSMMEKTLEAQFADMNPWPDLDSLISILSKLQIHEPKILHHTTSSHMPIRVGRCPIFSSISEPIDGLLDLTNEDCQNVVCPNHPVQICISNNNLFSNKHSIVQTIEHNVWIEKLLFELEK